jgi:hypothetical protein
MSPFLAFLLCCGVSAWLFREDMKWRRLESPALWIAGIWVAIAGSRSPTYWTDYLGLGSSAQSNLDGNPLNFLITSLLIVAALLVLSNRGYNWSAFAKANKSLCLIYLFFALSFCFAQAAMEGRWLRCDCGFAADSARSGCGNKDYLR